jgi:monoamine oxidase
MKHTIARRDFLRQSIFTAAAALTLPSCVPAAPRPGDRFSLLRTATPRKIVVAGGGLSGLSAAYELARVGHQVTVVEAQKRTGGRVLTLRTFDENLYADAGAARIPDDHEWTLHYVKEFKLKLLPFYADAGQFVRVRRGERAEVNWKQFAEFVENQIGITLGDGRGWHKIEGGNDLLPRAFSERLADEIIYGAPVSRIEQDAKGVRLTFSRGGTTETLAADYLVCAIPFAVLNRVEFAPALGEQKRRVLREMTYEFASRAFMQCRRRFWEEGRTNGFGITDQPAEVWPSTYRQPGTRGILQNYIRHPASVELMKLNEEGRIASSIERLEAVLPGVRANFERGTVKCWGEDEWAGCAWTHPSLGELSIITRPEGRIYFAGEHTSRWASWMHGALESGNRVAREIEEAAHAAAA